MLILVELILGNIYHMLMDNKELKPWNKGHPSYAKTLNQIKKYEHSKKGFLRKRYWNMVRRVKGTDGVRRTSNIGLPICTMKEFLEWANNPEFTRLWYSFVESGRLRSLTPTVDKIVPSLGYVIGNMQWLTMSENSIKGGANRRPNKQSIYIGVYKVGNSFIAHASKKGKPYYVGCFKSEEEAAKARDRWAKVFQGKHARLNFPDNT